MFGWETWKPEDACPTCLLNIDLIRPVFKKNSIKNINNSSQRQLNQLINQGTQFYGYNNFDNDLSASLADVGKLFIGALPHDFQDQDLGVHFKRWGTVIDHPVIEQKEREKDGRRRSRGFGFVRYRKN